MEDLIEQFWLNYAQLQFAVRTGDPEAVDAIDVVLEPAIQQIYMAPTAGAAEAQAQFNFFVDLITKEADDPASVLRTSAVLKGLIERYFSHIAAAGQTSNIGRRRTEQSHPADDSLLNEAILDSMPDRIAVVTPDYRYLYTNPRNAKTLGYRPMDMIGRHLVEFLGIQRFEQRAKAQLDRCFAGEQVEYTFAKESQGRTIVVRCRMTPCVSSTGRMLGAIIVLQEHADRRRSIAA